VNAALASPSHAAITAIGTPRRCINVPQLCRASCSRTRSIPNSLSIRPEVLAKGGIVFRVQQELGVPVKLVGLGEGPDDLAPFEPAAFVDALLG